MIFSDLKDFIIIDTETTGLGCYSKLVEFAGLKFRDGQVVESFQTFINPKMLMSQEVINIHGITNEMVSLAPNIEVASDKIYQFIGDDVLVAHNARFDMDVLNRRLLLGLNNRYVDSLTIFREALYLPSYKLDNIRKYFSINIVQTHRALDDVEMLYKCLLKIEKPYTIDVKGMGSVKGSCKASQIKQTKALSNKLNNCHCVVTGEIPNMARNQLWLLIVNNGGQVGDSVIIKTRYLIVGASNVGFTKLNKAKRKKANGDNIEIIGYRDFLKLIE